MCRKLSIIFLLCVAMLFPSIASAQEFNLFAKQKVVVADIRDLNDRKLSDGVKHMIRQGIIDACANSDNYEVYEVNIDDIKRQLAASGHSASFSNICKKIGSKADYIIFTNVKLSTSDLGAQNISIYITSSLYRIATASEMRSQYIESQPTSQSIVSSTLQLVSKLLGVSTSGQSASQNTYGSQPSQSTHQYTSYNQSQSSYSQTYKVGDYYDANGKQGVVFVVTPDGKHGKIVGLNNLRNMTWNSAVSACRNLGNGWRLPSDDELLAIYKVKSTLDSTLAAVGDGLPEGYHWSSIEFGSNYAWRVCMSSGTTYYDPKNYYYYVRAVSAF